MCLRRVEKRYYNKREQRKIRKQEIERGVEKIVVLIPRKHNRRQKKKTDKRIILHVNRGTNDTIMVMDIQSISNNHNIQTIFKRRQERKR